MFFFFSLKDTSKWFVYEQNVMWIKKILPTSSLQKYVDQGKTKYCFI